MEVKYYLSAGNWGDGKSVCLWRQCGVEGQKIARFQSDEAARLFAKEFNFPLGGNVKERLEGSDGS